MIKCNNCGHLMPDDARFCPNCGTKVEHEVYCRNCGKPMSPFDTVCPSCGTPVDSAGRDYGVNNELNGIFCNTPSGKNRGGKNRPFQKRRHHGPDTEAGENGRQNPLF